MRTRALRATRARGDEVLRRPVAVRRDGRVVDRPGDVAGGFSRRSSSPSTARRAGGATSPARTRGREPHSCGRSRAAGCTRASERGAGQVARCSARPASGPRSAGGHRQRRRDVRVDGAEQRAVGEVQGDADRPPARRAAVTQRPSSSRVVVGDPEERDCRAAAARPTPRRPWRRRGRRAGSVVDGHVRRDCNERAPRRVRGR